MEPDETAFVRFTPNSQLSDSDYANEVYNPPFSPDEDPATYLVQGNYFKIFNICYNSLNNYKNTLPKFDRTSPNS